MSISKLFQRPSPAAQHYDPTAPRRPASFFDRVAAELDGYGKRGPAFIRPAAARAARSPRLAAGALGVMALGAGLYLVTRKRTRAGAGALAAAVTAAARRSFR
ncbi:hypothetical protein P7B02_03680 [Caulobacter segnis]|uniref:hypothetical protein n=1 Tax=Caulobacter segnis TaxID=88688 RepID=UPI0024108E68|nr:hypothetical protein [Caulobacter segnis]MDG2520632.1 hypothetical protein [Caulobacter segnis]